MTNQELWQLFTEAHPNAKDEEYIIKLKSRGLKRLLNQAWDEGFNQSRQSQNINKNPFEDLFGRFK